MRLRGFALAALFIGGMASILSPGWAGSSKEKKPIEKAVLKSPTDEEIIHAIILNQDIKLTSHASCASAIPLLQGQTMGDFFSHLISLLQRKEEGGKGLTMVVTKELKAEDGRDIWHCQVDFANQDPESPWKYGIAFKMRAKELMIIRDSFYCPGPS